MSFYLYTSSQVLMCVKKTDSVCPLSFISAWKRFRCVFLVSCSILGHWVGRVLYVLADLNIQSKAKLQLIFVFPFKIKLPTFQIWMILKNLSVPSCHYPFWLFNIPKGQFVRMRRNCTRESDFITQSRFQVKDLFRGI